MTTAKSFEKIACLNPRTGNTHNIAKEKYEVIAKAIRHVLKHGKGMVLSELIDDVKAYLAQHKTKFEGSLSWYTVSVKLDMEARGTIETYQEKGRKMNRLAK